MTFLDNNVKLGKDYKLKVYEVSFHPPPPHLMASRNQCPKKSIHDSKEKYPYVRVGSLVFMLIYKYLPQKQLFHVVRQHFRMRKNTFQQKN